MLFGVGVGGYRFIGLGLSSELGVYLLPPLALFVEWKAMGAVEGLEGPVLSALMFGGGLRWLVGENFMLSSSVRRRYAQNKDMPEPIQKFDELMVGGTIGSRFVEGDMVISVDWLGVFIPVVDMKGENKDSTLQRSPWDVHFLHVTTGFKF